MTTKDFSNLTVLWLDDDHNTLDLMVVILKGLGVNKIITCDNAKSAITQLVDHSTQIDIAFCDVHMPDMDGIELIRELGSQGCKNRLAFVTIATNDIIQSLDVFGEAYKMSLLPTLKKPVSPEEVAEALESCLK